MSIFENYLIFIALIPLVIVYNLARSKTLRNAFITLFVIVWLVFFHYESIRYFYLNPISGKDLPKTKFLFPPAGWIMFFRVDDGYGFREVYGVKENKIQLIDPHDIFRTRTIGFDNIHRGILSSAASARQGADFCRYLSFRFPYFDNFVIQTTVLNNMTENSYDRNSRIEYKCY